MLRLTSVLHANLFNPTPDAREFDSGTFVKVQTVRTAQRCQRDHDATYFLFWLANGTTEDIIDQLMSLRCCAAESLNQLHRLFQKAVIAYRPVVTDGGSKAFQGPCDNVPLVGFHGHHRPHKVLSLTSKNPSIPLYGIGRANGTGSSKTNPNLP